MRSDHISKLNLIQNSRLPRVRQTQKHNLIFSVPPQALPELGEEKAHFFVMDKAEKIQNDLGRNRRRRRYLRKRCVTDGGLLNLENRREAWPILLEVE